jgi:transcriptional regulator with XRE-family HTH domain
MSSATDREVMQMVGARLRALRRAQEASILDTAAATGLSRMTISRAEHGDNPTLLTVVRLLRAYGRLAALEGFIPEATVSPVALLRERRRRTGTKAPRSNGIPLGAFRCNGCGFLEFYASEEFAAT